MKMLKKLFARTQSNCIVTVNGKTYQSANGNISINGNQVYIDGVPQQDLTNDKDIKVVINGDCGEIECAGEVTVNGNVHGDIDAGNSVTVSGNSDGYIDAGNSITIAGNHTGGSVDAGNFVKIGK